MGARDPEKRALEAIRQRLAQRFTERVGVAEASLPELRDLQERLHFLDAALADPGGVDRRRKMALGSAAVGVAAVLSIGALVPMPSVPFSLEAEAGAARLQFAAAAEFGPQPVGGELAVDGYTRLESPDAAITAQAASAAGGGRLSIGATALTLRRLSFPAQSTIDVAAGTPAVVLTLQSLETPIGVALEFSGRTVTRAGADGAPRSAEYPYAEWIRLQAGDAARAGRSAPPVTLTLERAADAAGYRWSNLRPQDVRFVERGVAGTGEATVASSLLKAQLQLLASGAEVTLAAGEDLHLGGLELQRFELEVGPVLRLKMSGTARTLVTRAGPFERSLKPSVLEYAARHKTVALLWGAALLLWGLARGLLRAFGGPA